MNEKELRNLQVYIGKRTQNQMDDMVIEHIKKINQKAPLSQEEWKKLLIPCCNNGMDVILRFVLDNIVELNDVKDLMKHTVYGRNINLSKKRIEVLKILADYLSGDEKEIVLSETMLNAAWFGDTEIVKFLISFGANRDYINATGLDLTKCAERVETQFKDTALREYICK